MIIDQPEPHAHEIGGGASESRLDLLLAEELAVNHEFAAWFLEESGARDGRSPSRLAAVTSSRVRLNLNEDGEDLPEGSAGETDVELTVDLNDGSTVTVLIEDKLWAPFQDRQPERYAMRAEARGCRCVLVAPRSYLAGRPERAAKFDGQVEIEAMIEHLLGSATARSEGSSTEGRRALWRARLLQELAARPVAPESDPATVAFTDFCLRWFHDHDPSVIPRPRSLHTTGQGWLYFEVPAGLGYKAVGWSRKPRAAVDLYVRDHGFAGTVDDLRALTAEIGLPDGFYVDADTRRNALLRCDCEKVNPFAGEPAGDVIDDVVQALEACSRASEWVLAHEAQLSASPDPARGGGTPPTPARFACAQDGG